MRSNEHLVRTLAHPNFQPDLREAVPYPDDWLGRALSA